MSELTEAAPIVVSLYRIYVRRILAYKMNRQLIDFNPQTHSLKVVRTLRYNNSILSCYLRPTTRRDGTCL